MIELDNHDKRSNKGSVTLVIDTSYGLTVGLAGEDVIVEHDSHQHVELLQPTIAKLMSNAGKQPQDIDTIVVGIGPAPFTGLRTGIVAAKAIAYTVGSQLLGQDILSAQAVWAASCMQTNGMIVGKASEPVRQLTLVVNDARRRQLYFALYDSPVPSRYESGKPLLTMDIDYPDRIVDRVNKMCSQIVSADPNSRIVVNVTGRGVDKYADSWHNLIFPGVVQEDSLFDHGLDGIDCFVACAQTSALEPVRSIEPLYLRRPDISIPNPSKHVMQV
ncbi:tRNA (adenosine(37)-N6)-threonylcarbamoyltransferase complex dimerization subunit type 1 TsaB [Bombiscardovia coagulans]|uniref:tRNA threonylcarbamoyladenosine biosynthesis protein TsaB n=1 Tax=Bombiscardovia coagulans TaxID=686666 RepID=A0A261ESV7_9BIFI|nr:tRNA (adenosine(37)-N6)-threonylcarbamoyltransferase complex dimerization subunit type 1 TsaB [Bombiscardovia coagulans]OZG49941.1 tRNA threonylcarbamoyladenosine biosynthesis protein TsaB [Bombiscardovia coagulans]